MSEIKVVPCAVSAGFAHVEVNGVTLKNGTGDPYPGETFCVLQAEALAKKAELEQGFSETNLPTITVSHGAPPAAAPPIWKEHPANEKSELVEQARSPRVPNHPFNAYNSKIPSVCLSCGEAESHESHRAASSPVVRTQPTPVKDSILRGWSESYEFSAKVHESAEILTKRIGEAAIKLAIIRGYVELTGENTEDEIVSAVNSVLLGEDSGCIDPEDLDDTNCEFLFADKYLREQFDILPLLRRIAPAAPVAVEPRRTRQSEVVIEHLGYGIYEGEILRGFRPTIPEAKRFAEEIEQLLADSQRTEGAGQK